MRVCFANSWRGRQRRELNTAGEVLSVGDVLTHTFTVINRSNNELRDVAVHDVLTGLDEMITLADGEVSPTKRPYNVQSPDMELSQLVNTLNVTVGDLEETATATTPVWATEACDWIDPDEDGVFELGTIQTGYQPCRWTADEG